MSFSQSGWGVGGSNCIWVHLRQVGNSNTVWVGSSTGHSVGWRGGRGLDSVIRCNAMPLQLSRLNPHCLTWSDNHREKEKRWMGKREKERERMVTDVIFQCPAGGWGVKWKVPVLRSPWTWNMAAVGTRLPLSSVSPQSAELLSFLSRYLCHTKETSRDFFNIDRT